MSTCNDVIQADSDCTNEFYKNIESARKNLDKESILNQLSQDCTVAKKLLLSTTGVIITGKVTVNTETWKITTLTAGMRTLIKREISKASEKIRNIADQLENELDDLYVIYFSK